jgi:hypothetical protein
MASLTRNLIVSALANESFSSRFEEYANSVVSAIEGGVVVVSTSTTWDLGRDGRGLQGSGIFVCASLAGCGKSQFRIDSEAEF